MGSLKRMDQKHARLAAIAEAANVIVHLLQMESSAQLLMMMALAALLAAALPHSQAMSLVENAQRSTSSVVVRAGHGQSAVRKAHTALRRKVILITLSACRRACQW